MPCVFSSASTWKHLDPPATQTSDRRLQMSGAVTLWGPRKSKTSVLLIIYMRRRWAASRRSMMKAGQMKRRADEDHFFFFFNQTFALPLQRGWRSQHPIKTRHQKWKLKTAALFITVLCFVLYFSMKSATCSTCSTTTVTINFSSSVCRCNSSLTVIVVTCPRHKLDSSGKPSITFICLPKKRKEKKKKKKNLQYLRVTLSWCHRWAVSHC